MQLALSPSLDLSLDACVYPSSSFLSSRTCLKDDRKEDGPIATPLSLSFVFFNPRGNKTLPRPILVERSQHNVRKAQHHSQTKVVGWPTLTYDLNSFTLSSHAHTHKTLENGCPLYSSLLCPSMIDRERIWAGLCRRRTKERKKDRWKEEETDTPHPLFSRTHT
jgi:hypothetical protein